MRNNNNHKDPFGVIRAGVEAEISAPGILAVSSARSADGKTAVAAGIVRSLAAAGYRTLAIDAAGASAASLCHSLGAKPAPPVSIAAAGERLNEVVQLAFAGCHVLVLAASSEAGPSAPAIEALYAAVRASYDYAIVDTRAVGDGGVTFARCADGVVLSVREGRAVAAADGEAVELLARVRARVLGVVAAAGNGRKPHESGDGNAAPERRILARLFNAFTSSRESRRRTVGSTTTD